MKKTGIIAFCMIVLGTSVYAQNGKFIQKFMEKQFDAGSAENSGPTPDYSNLNYWAASPFKHDNSDTILAFLKNEVRDDKVDVFFIHPTSFTQDMQNAAWNANLDDASLDSITNFRSILYQSSVFNGSCRVFAPRYRQANLKAFYVRTSPSAQIAFDLAYSDVKAAFQYYLVHHNNGRPIIIASHSQGSLHAIRLLKEFFDGKPLQKQLVCAYVIGYQIKKNAFESIPLGTTPSATGCVVGWRSYQKGELPEVVKRENGNSLCVNPLTWSADTRWASETLNKGSLVTINILKTPGASAGIEPTAHILWVTLPENTVAKIKNLKNLHIYDYNLFWMNIRENVKLRIEAYLKKQ